MKQNIVTEYLIYLILFTGILISCDSAIGQAVWTQKANFAGTLRYSASFFSINGKGYIGLGYDGVRKSDFWEYDPSTNVWTQKATYPINSRNATANFTI